MTDAWAQVRAELAGSADSGPNISAIVLTRHVRAGAGGRIALRWRPRTGPTVSVTWSELDAAASRFASGLERAGLTPGDTVAVLSGRVPEAVIAILGTMRAGAVATVLFSSYGPEPIRRRLDRARAKVLVTTARLYRDKVASLRGSLPGLRRVLVIEPHAELDVPDERVAIPEGTESFRAWLAAGDPHFPDARVSREDPALLHFTSGTTGEPKGAIHAHDAVTAHAHTARSVLGIRADTPYWCTADPGWVTGISYGVLAPLALGSTLFMDEEDFEPRRWWENLARERVEVLYTSPTALRLLRRMHDPDARAPALPDLRGVFSVGEPLTPADGVWAAAALGVPVRDTWWQTETGCIVVATSFDEAPRPGKVGRAARGFDVRCIRRTGDGVESTAVGEVGELAVRAGWPSMFRSYLDEPALYEACFRDGWYLSGDLATLDHEGWLAWVGRANDVFKSAGHLVAPAEVEAVLLEHPAVADAAVRGSEDPTAGTVVEAWVVLAEADHESEERCDDILRFARERLGPALAPRVLHIRHALPRTSSGKVLRKDLDTPPRERGFAP